VKGDPTIGSGSQPGKLTSLWETGSWTAPALRRCSSGWLPIPERRKKKRGERGEAGEGLRRQSDHCPGVEGQVPAIGHYSILVDEVRRVKAEGKKKKGRREKGGRIMVGIGTTLISLIRGAAPSSASGGRVMMKKKRGEGRTGRRGAILVLITFLIG